MIIRIWNVNLLLFCFVSFIQQFPGCLQACQFFHQNADVPQKDPVMPTSAEPSVQLVGNLATWPRPSGGSSVTVASNGQQHATIGAAKSVKESIAKERLVYAVIQKQSSGRWRQIIQVRIKKKN